MQQDKSEKDKKETNKTNSSEDEKVSNCTTVLPVKKSVSFNLNQTQNIPPSPTKFKRIIFNGTYPIDCPIKYDAESNEFERDYLDDEFYYKEDDGEDDEEEDDDDENYSDNESSLAIHKFLVDKRIPINYKKMCTDVENSITQFENLLNERRKSMYLRTFEIDAPVEPKKNV